MKGKCSLLIEDNGDDNIKIYKLDNENKTNCDFINSITSLSNADEEKKIKALIDDGVVSNKVLTKNISMTKSNQPLERVLNYYCFKYKAVGTLFITKEKAKKDENNSSINKLVQYKDFVIYFLDGCKQRKDIIKNRISKEQEIHERNKRYSIIKSEISNSRVISSINNFSCDDSFIDKKLEEKAKKKNINLNVWISESFPIKISHFIPLLHILSFTSTEFSKLKSTLCAKNLPFKSFPLKISYPLKLSFYVLLSVIRFSVGSPNKAIFDPNYFNTDSYGSMDTTENVIKQDLTYKTASLDDNYASDFYDNYFKEKNLKKNREKNSDFNNGLNSEEEDDDLSLGTSNRLYKNLK